jgi:osmotically-inducible protein OsmY
MDSLLARRLARELLMDTRTHDQALEMRVSQALLSYKPGIERNIIVAATPDGSVWLRGLVSGQIDRLKFLAVVGKVPGVTQVFFDIGRKA